MSTQLTYPNSCIIYNSNTSISPQLQLPHLENQFAQNMEPSKKSHSINKFIANALQKVDSKECEQSGQLSPMSTIIDTKSTNHYRIFKQSAKTKNSIYKYQARYSNSFCSHKSLSNKYSKSNLKSTLPKMPRGKSSKFQTPTRTRVTFSDNSPANTTLGANKTSTTDTTSSTNTLDTAEDQRLTATINKIFNEKLLAILTGKRGQTEGCQGLCVAQR